MLKALNITIIVLCGIVGGWVGYWLGHAAGWSENAVWPSTIGGGTGAIVTSIVVSVAFVVASALIITFVPERGVRKVLAHGAVAGATVVRMKETGAVRWAHEGARHQVVCDLEVRLLDRPPYQARTTQFVSPVVECVLRPGASVTVRYDPEHPSHVAIDKPFARAA